MIIKDELKNIIKEYFKSKVSEKVDAWDLVDICVDLQRLIDELDSDIWTPIDEGTPSDGRYVLLSFENYTGIDIGRYEEDKDGGAFYPGDDDKSYTSYGIFVNAWMELPERYKGVTHENQV